MSLVLSGYRADVCPRSAAGEREPAFRALPLWGRVHSTLVIALAVVLVTRRASHVTVDEPLLFTVLLLLAGIGGVLRAPLAPGPWGASLSVSHAVGLAALLLAGPDTAAILMAVAGVSQCTLGLTRPCTWHRTAFSTAVLVLSIEGAGVVFDLAGGAPTQGARPGAGLERALIVAAAAQLLLNAGLIASSLALTSRVALAPWRADEIHWGLLVWLCGTAGALGSVFVLDGPGRWLTPLILAPTFLAYTAYTRSRRRLVQSDASVEQVADLHMATIEALALAIDAKDQTSAGHVRRMEVFTTGLARALGMSRDEVQGVRTAALLHDIGKLAVPEHILSKPGPLTPEEFQKVRIHPQIGAEIIAGVAFPYPVAPFIRNHHERWDGKGYPAGHRGEEIPLGARIISVADYYDALTSDRPYHRAKPRHEAIEVLKEAAGVALDPRIVELFVRLLPSLEAEIERHGPPGRTLSFTSPRVERARREEPAARVAAAPRVLQDIALAHREIYTLYQIAQGMGASLGVADAMAILTSKLRELVPFSTCALFLPGDDDVLRCAFAEGVAAEALQAVLVEPGHGLIGWVATNRRALVNARPAAEFGGGDPDSPQLEAALVSPLVLSDRLVGVLALYDALPGTYTDDHRRVIERVCEQAAGVVSNSILFEQTKRDSLTDALTGLPNTRFMFVHLTRELARAERLRSEVSLLVMDLDDFKEINDGYGHHAGDRALREVARVLRAGIRPYDICVRYAGDEFVVVLSGCGAEEAELKMRELQRALAEASVEVRPGRCLKLGGSFGRASFPGDGRAQETLLAVADKRMYEDKARRKVQRAEAGQPEGTSSDWRTPFANMATRSSSASLAD